MVETAFKTIKSKLIWPQATRSHQQPSGCNRNPAAYSPRAHAAVARATDTGDSIVLDGLHDIVRERRKSHALGSLPR